MIHPWDSLAPASLRWWLLPIGMRRSWEMPDFREVPGRGCSGWRCVPWSPLPRSSRKRPPRTRETKRGTTTPVLGVSATRPGRPAPHSTLGPAAAPRAEQRGKPTSPPARPEPGFGLPTQPKPDKEKQRGVPDAAPRLLLTLVYKHSFFLLCYLLFSRLRNRAQDLIWVSLFKCPNPCKGLVSGCVHFAQY